MKVVSLTQPWATLMALDEKRYETRGRVSWRNYRGPLAIHASKGFPAACRKLCVVEPFRSVLRAHGITDSSQLPLGKIIAVTNMLFAYDAITAAHVICELREGKNPPLLADVVPAKHELEFGDYSDERFALITSGVRRLRDPIPASGSLGLWNFDDGDIRSAL